MAWLRAADTEVKRDMEIARDEVRVMTVHGAKGLEASVVFLVDTTTSPSDTQRSSLIRMPQGNAAPHTPGVVLWAGKKADDLADVATARAAMKDETEDEYRRLLYVAMTRAADRLIVGGVLPGNRNSVRELSWYDLITKGLDASDLQLNVVETAHGPVKRYSRAGDVEPPAPAIIPQPDSAPMDLPSWLKMAAAPEEPPDVLLRPSDPVNGEDEGHAVVSDEARSAHERALMRGTLTHRLLQSLPDVAPERRAAAAGAFLARNAKDSFTDAERDALARQVLDLIAAPAFAPLFTDGSRAEVSIVGRLELPGRPLVSGQIDRLVVTADEVLIVDFKTNQVPPKSPSEAPAAYVRQLALYRAVLRRLYPQRAIRAALLWTATVEYMEISAPALDAALASLHVGVSELDPARSRS
jgi:ATP-dependent helicase/nuclease subunit A